MGIFGSVQNQIGQAIGSGWQQANQQLAQAQAPYLTLRHLSNANEYASLTAYVQALLRCEPNCKCKWCSASELERQAAIAQFFAPEPAAP